MSTAMALAKNILSFCITTRDDGATPAAIYAAFSGGPEGLRELFITDDYDVVSIIGDPSMTPERFLQDEQVYETWEVPIRMMSINKYGSGSLVSTAPVTLQKCIALLTAQINVSKHGSEWVATLSRMSGGVTRRAGMDIHEEQIVLKVRVMV
jgi:hypothetical protein